MNSDTLKISEDNIENIDSTVAWCDIDLTIQEIVTDEIVFHSGKHSRYQFVKDIALNLNKFNGWNYVNAEFILLSLLSHLRDDQYNYIKVAWGSISIINNEVVVQRLPSKLAQDASSATVLELY